MGMVKVCSKCKTTKRLEDYFKARHHKDGRESWCKVCKNKRSVEIYAENIVHARKFRANWRKNNPGYYLTQYWPGKTPDECFAEYTRLLHKQNNVCAICKGIEKHKHALSGNVRKLCVDHCHKTGIVRGLLCSECNRSLGAYRDEPEHLKSLFEYLRAYI